MSFRRRVMLASLAVLAVGVGAVLVVGNVLLAERVEGEVSGLLRARTEAAVAALDLSGTRAYLRETLNDQLLDRRTWVLAGGRIAERPPRVSLALDAAATALGRRGTTAERDGPGDVRLRSRPVAGASGRGAAATVVVAVSTGPFRRLQREVLVGSIVVGLLVLLAGALAISGAIRRALAPVTDMTEAAADWGEHDLDRRFALGPATDELTALAATLDGLLGRIAASRRHEQRFASEMAHELRTPVAALRARAELALGAEGAAATDEHAAALRAVVAQAQRLDDTITTLLAVARRELDPAGETVDLLAVVRSIEGAEVVAPTALPAAEGEADVVRRALQPLLDNARRHARSRVWIELGTDDGHVTATVRDDGPGLDPALGEDAFAPGARGGAPGGAGLGLPLARRLARSCGGDVTAGPGPGGAFVLRLPAL